MPSNPQIQINTPTVDLNSDWKIQAIAKSDCGELKASNVRLDIFGEYLPYEPI